MKKIILLAILYISLTTNIVMATTPISGDVEVREIVTSNKSSQQLNFYGSSLVDGNILGISGVASVSKDYSEAYIGPIWMPAPWISLEAGVGLQQIENGSPLRYALAGWIGNSIGSLYYIREMGADSDDWWEKLRIFANLGEFAKIGVVYEKGYDWGPIIEIPIPSSRFKIRATWHPEPNIAHFSLFFNF
ncbi:MAG: Uncharacterized protein Athens101428_94 [Candidatus Berkelbacteria bacterium Athens1014_28]|uniref:Uncharacterized protein n=1 Tax=Candidatus Berkelbacteria bacterium Athens1014_28 TaxID=2017145 RepID=A0A554LPT9_9BACT|nr:MAG: Uncharacterized protein Athens101428_94 [Candidatus Berkelbacteria bacterium Athens1014_28]